MTSEDQKMLQSALWHISNSVTNGKSQTAECEITKWLKEKFNPLPAEQPSEDLEEAARNIRDTLYLKEGKRDEYGNPYFLQDTLLKAVIAGADWQKNRDKQILSTLYDDCSCLKDSLDKVTTGNLSHRISNIKFSITGMQVFIKHTIGDKIL